MVHFERSVLSHLPTSSMVEVVQDPKAIFKVSRQKMALAPAQE
jgi:putative transposase